MRKNWERLMCFGLACCLMLGGCGGHGAKDETNTSEEETATTIATDTDTEEDLTTVASETDVEPAYIENEDGSFTLNDVTGVSNAVILDIPSGYSLYEYYSSETFLMFLTGDTDSSDGVYDYVSASYLFDGSTCELNDDVEEYLTSSFLEPDFLALEGSVGYSGISVSELQSVTVSDRTVYYYRATLTYNYSSEDESGEESEENYSSSRIILYSWTFVDDGQVLFCTVSESAYNQDCEILANAVNDTATLEAVYEVIR